MATEDPQVQSDPAGNPDLPNPTFSDPGSSQSDAEADALVSKLIEKLTPKIEDTLEKRIQSIKDSRLDKVDQADRFRKALRGRPDLLAELEDAGVEIPKDVRTEMRLRELEGREAEPSTQLAQPRVDGSTQQRAAVSEAIAELSKYGLDQNDAGFIELLRGKYANRAEFDLKIQRYIVGKIAPQKPANPADVVQSPVTAGATSKGVETLALEYKTKMLAAPRGRAGDAQRAALKAEYERQGVPTHSIDFTA